MSPSSSSTPPVQKYRGVRKRKSGRWSATTKDGKTQIWLGTFNTAVEAAIAYDRAVVKLRGESAVTNFPQPPNAGEVALVINPPPQPFINQE